MIGAYDLAKDSIRDISSESVPLDSSKIQVENDSPLEITLKQWEGGSTFIGISVEGLGTGRYKGKMYGDVSDARKDFDELMSHIRNDNYTLVYQKGGNLDIKI